MRRQALCSITQRACPIHWPLQLGDAQQGARFKVTCGDMMSRYDHQRQETEKRAERERQKPYVETGASIGLNVDIGSGSWIRLGSSITDSVLGDDVFVGFRSHISNASISHNCLIGSLACIGHGGGARVHVSRAVWIGARAVIEPGVRIGLGAVIGAGAHIREDVPADVIVVGRPGRVLRKRTVLEDGMPNFHEILGAVRSRRSANQNGRAPTRERGGLEPEGIMDVDICDGGHMQLGSGIIAIGRANAMTQEGGIAVGVGIRIGDRAVLEASGGVTMGDGVKLGCETLIASSGHDLTRRSLPWRGCPVSIGSWVEVGHGTTIVGPARIGERARIMPGSVIVGDVGSGQTSFGVFGRARR